MEKKIIIPVVLSIHTTDDSDVNNTPGSSSSVKIIKNVTNTDIFELLPRVNLNIQHSEKHKDINCTNGIKHFRLNETIINNKVINVSNTYLTPVISVLNFTNKPITVRSFDNIPKVIYNIKGRDISYDNKIFIMTSHNLINPNSVLYSKLDNNYLESLKLKFKDDTNPYNQELKNILNYYSENYKEITREIDNITIKINTACIIDVNDLEEAKDNTIFVLNKDILISLKGINEIPEHPRTSITHNTEDSILTDIINDNNASFFIVDSDNRLSKKFFNLFNEAIEIPVINNNDDHLDGLYIINKVNGIIADRNFTLEQINDLDFIYNSMEEAITGGDIQLKSKKEIEQLTFDNNKIKIELERIKSENENKKSDLDLSRIREKNYYESRSFQRESTIETLKTSASLVSAGILLYSVFNKFANSKK
ncbi:MAG: hypothetical protein ACD_33C00009G0002 [uncultured bacterium]|nr:MAG: hypothetical protein ACD_33C00009G0002 [uncultured bacterium]